mmetsp:Transcript_76796/g.152278  ORF Transcript_76796/g.152278 Transcript_76796/m.152278 type:complete len:220 (+) Transcript_76796:1597-2256(+)
MWSPPRATKAYPSGLRSSTAHFCRTMMCLALRRPPPSESSAISIASGSKRSARASLVSRGGHPAGAAAVVEAAARPVATAKISPALSTVWSSRQRRPPQSTSRKRAVLLTEASRSLPVPHTCTGASARARGGGGLARWPVADVALSGSCSWERKHMQSGHARRRCTCGPGRKAWTWVWTWTWTCAWKWTVCCEIQHACRIQPVRGEEQRGSGHALPGSD